MTELQAKFKNVINYYGDSFTISSVSRKGIFINISVGRARIYVSDALAESFGRPIRMVFVPFDESATVGQTLTWNSITLVIYQVVHARFQGNTVARLLIVAP